jgi:hypothetical protein
MHLSVGTHKQNSQDMVAKRRNKNSPMLGDKNPSSKLNAEKVREIRALAGVKKQREIAKLYGVDQQVVWSAINRKTWKHVY